MKYMVLIPARLESTRLPRKPLINILGKSLIERTYLQVMKAVNRNAISVLTDSEEILDHCKQKGMNCLMTSKDCITGTDRIAEFAKINPEFQFFVNVQGDEPIVNPDDIKKLIESMENSQFDVVNGYAEIKEESEYLSLTIPKVVFRPDSRLLYMSRSPIPGNKKGEFVKAWKQVCIYAYTKEALNKFSEFKVKTNLEEKEDIELLRFLELGFEVGMVELEGNSIAVDVLEDIDKVISKIQLTE